MSDRTVLRLYLENYRKTGRCELLPQLKEIARLADLGQLTPPKKARSLFSDLDAVECSLPALLDDLSCRVSDFNQNIQKGQQPGSEARRELLQQLTETFKFVERLAAIARDYPDPPEWGLDKGFEFEVNLPEQVKDLRYRLARVQEYLRPQSLQHRLNRHPNPDSELNNLVTDIENLCSTAMMLTPRLRENIARQVPEFWAKVDLSTTVEMDSSEVEEMEPVKTPMSREEFLKCLEAGQREFQHLILDNLDFQGVDLTGVILTDSSVQGSNFAHAILTNANLSETNCDRANFSRATLNGALFCDGSLVGANLNHCQAIGVNFTSANLSHANLSWANLKDSNLLEVKLENANLYGVNWEGTNQS